MGCGNGCCFGKMHLWFSYLAILQLVLLVCVDGQNPNSNDFISIDCGLPGNTSYVDTFTGLTYVSDDQYIDTGLNGKISSQYPVNKNTYADLETLRSFPNGTKNCYTITPVTKGSKYLVRATFYYGNYDKSDNIPKFDLYFGVNFWVTVDMSRPDYWYGYEIIAIAPDSFIQICLVNTGLGTPFISVLELRPMNSDLYELANATQSLKLISRGNVGSNYTIVRYPDDYHDRIWYNYTKTSWDAISTSSSMDGFEVPSLVLQTAAVSSTSSSSIDIKWSTFGMSTIYFVMLHFAEIEIMQNNSLREFYIYANGEQVFDKPTPLKYLSPSVSSYTSRGYTEYNLSIRSSPRATLPPILNAFELYTILPVTVLPTDSRDVNAINSIKEIYSINNGWSGDPCVPTRISWTGVECTINSSNIPRITALNLSSSGLTGTMVSAFGYLTELTSLDLSHNNISGAIPSSLDQLKSLTFLDLSENDNLSVILPPGLQNKQNNGRLTVIFNSTPVQPVHKKSSKITILVVVAVAITLLVVGAVALFLLYSKKRETQINPQTSHLNPDTTGKENSSHAYDGQEDLTESGAGGKELNFEKKKFSYEDLKLITNNFSYKLGIGGFGEVFKGQLEDGNEVAVKLHSDTSSQGAEEFLNEVEKLSRVHHKNLVSLIGYCKDRNHTALIYEYMHEGNLQDWLKGNVKLSLSWKQRLRIAYESAQGLDYLHKMCNPPLIHRDVKTSNILLTRNLEAKVSDFGLVRACTGTHVSTNVMGTVGYLDPYYASTYQLTTKSDVYSFGVVLLEIVTGKPPTGKGLQKGQHLTQFVHQKLSKGNIEGILDPYIGNTYNINSIWKVAELGLRCTDHPDKRPDMTVVVTELMETLNLEMNSPYSRNLASQNISECSTYSRNDNPVGDAIGSGSFEMAQIGVAWKPDYGPSVR